ncbi:hypothetical protein M431DRAFT_494253 [Trichoderma harzianum CBS 226.95]|uniref:DUF4238 domain-containing protein n=1 Tax=Trichoderma harzianum CBS 226.95 TaxID=983964 RepID=A0A2T4AFE2_TRIHA|nr:hypothetical protein M431DRAFT_494253 [Trichoderma harzianum CBS 226.95]PTB55815.1 hypothetical protein M431DRAFT_494253 [Trichoderma harzianum CBS 226.95]
MERPQYQHYIPRFILKHFTFAESIGRRSAKDGLLHVLELPRGGFKLANLSKTCGEYNLYDLPSSANPRNIEELFSDLESKSSQIFGKIRDAVAKSLDHIDILEKDIQILFKFMDLSRRRSEYFRDDIADPYRKNDFMFQEMFEQARNQGQSDDPSQFWLEGLQYLLQTSHEDLLTDANKNAWARTYSHYIERYSLQIWKAADGHEFFLNESLVDFEGDTESYMGAEEKEDGRLQLVMMTLDDVKHIILPISPKIAIIFCDESRCWESPFAEILHKRKIPYPENSLLKSAPHKDITSIPVPEQRRGKIRWPATEAWRVNIGKLSAEHHQIINSYSLLHAQSLIIVRSRKCFEQAKRSCDSFSTARIERWESQGSRYTYDNYAPRNKENVPELSGEQSGRIVNDFMLALDRIVCLVQTTNEPLPTTKKNIMDSWMAMCALESCVVKDRSLQPGPVGEIAGMHPEMRAAFEAAFPPKHASHRNLIEMDFMDFFHHGFGEQGFARLMDNIGAKAREIIPPESFTIHWDSCKAVLQQILTNTCRVKGEKEDALLENQTWRSVCILAQNFATLQWMFEERQDILAVFVGQLSKPLGELYPEVIRMRAPRT